MMLLSGRDVQMQREVIHTYIVGSTEFIFSFLDFSFRANPRDFSSLSFAQGCSTYFRPILESLVGRPASEVPLDCGH